MNTANCTDQPHNALQVPCDNVTDEYFFNLWTARQLHELQCRNGTILIPAPVERSGFGGILRVRPKHQFDLSSVQSLLRMLAPLVQTPLSSLSNKWEPLQQILVEEPADITQTETQIAANGLTLIQILPPQHNGGLFNFTVGALGVARGESAKLPEAVDVQYAQFGEAHARVDHSLNVPIKTFKIMKYKVTNQNYKDFLEVTGWRPAVEDNWLLHWSEKTARNYSFELGQEHTPVRWVSRDDAIAYCAAQGSGMRLPHEWEWQFAAQGSDGRPWPWGSIGDNSSSGYVHVPNVSHSRTMPAPPAVDAYPLAVSPFGVEALVGSVYEWTDAYADEHTVRAVLRGGSYWSPLPNTSLIYRYFFNQSNNVGFTDGAPNWYLPNPQDPIGIGASNVKPVPTPLTHHTTMLLMADGLDRSGGIGFRCAASVE